MDKTTLTLTGTDLQALDLALANIIDGADDYTPWTKDMLAVHTKIKRACKRAARNNHGSSYPSSTPP